MADPVVLLTPRAYWLTWAFMGCCFLLGLFVVIRSAILSAHREIAERERTRIGSHMTN